MRVKKGKEIYQYFNKLSQACTEFIHEGAQTMSFFPIFSFAKGERKVKGAFAPFALHDSTRLQNLW